ncbi:nuclear transport factor 2 family protein [Flavobacterium rhamnosiphilum]|uniref:Nuclear transport factor 2 family protein n=1 Tax=Flavobacterium rhamnosiphilum TaxID=2541724 RepID=A0A4R5F678_9FLAO|nr:nuclear transport factor 2 family protein [Flavobacterium rhamnosiphilum]TDE43448.1 nuclear transport factor 2 family protein [Flavobacterium rhamnosiphilum]
MKKFLLIFVLFISANSQAQNQEIQKVVEFFFEAFHAKDTLKLQALCEDTMILQSITESTKGNKLSNEKPQVFFKSIASIPAELKFQEKILSYSIQVDGSMAHAWTPYEFYLNGKLSHKGVNAFTLFKKDNVWKIVHLIDTRRK